MNIGKVRISGRAFLAPMAGVTDLPFRRICMEMGAALTYTEMVSAKGLLHSPEKSATLLAGGGELQPAAIQLFGNEPELLADMAERYCGDFNIIDINMGCPVSKVVRAGQGSALMRQPEWAAKLVKTLAVRTGKPITVKIRKGWDEKHVNAEEFAARMQDAGAAAVAVHGRTREQFYTGEADWDIIAKVKRRLSIPVIGSGDINSAENAKDMLDMTGCDYIMVARGGQGNPWLFAQINSLLDGKAIEPPAFGERLAVALRHAQGLIDMKGERIAVQQMRKHLGWYIKGIPHAAVWRERLNRLNTMVEIVLLLDEVRASCQ
jgi:tRNA-dihydrouridine synthase B